MPASVTRAAEAEGYALWRRNVGENERRRSRLSPTGVNRIQVQERSWVRWARGFRCSLGRYLQAVRRIEDVAEDEGGL